MTFSQKIHPIVSSFILLGLTLIATAVWYTAYRSDIIADGWMASQGVVLQQYEQ